MTSHSIFDLNFDYKGYLGVENFRAADTFSSDIKWLDHGNEPGTTIRILGWMAPPVWREILIGYAIARYFSAILKGKLSLKVGNYHLEKVPFHSFLSDQNFLDKIRKHDENCFNEIDLAKWYARCLAGGPDVEKDDSEVIGLGNSKLKLIVEEGAPFCFGILRNDILITSDLPGFYVRKPATIKDCIGLYECVNPTGQKLLRRMEPPQHDNFSPDLLYDGDRIKGKRH